MCHGVELEALVAADGEPFVVVLPRGKDEELAGGTCCRHQVGRVGTAGGLVAVPFHVAQQGLPSLYGKGYHVHPARAVIIFWRTAFHGRFLFFGKWFVAFVALFTHGVAFCDAKIMLFCVSCKSKKQ